MDKNLFQLTPYAVMQMWKAYWDNEFFPDEYVITPNDYRRARELAILNREQVADRMCRFYQDDWFTELPERASLNSFINNFNRFTDVNKDRVKKEDKFLDSYLKMIQEEMKREE